MKKSWEYKKLDDVCTIVGRIGFRGYTKADLVNSSKDGAITLSPSNIINGELDFSKCTYINWDKYYESPEIMLENGDIVLVKTASIGKCAVVKNLPHEATLNPQFVVLKHLVGVPDFICYYLKSSIAQNTIKQMAGGVAIPTLSQKKLGMMIVPTPSQDEQQSIVDYLDSAFAKIDAMKANAEKALNEAKALFQASLEMLEPKEGWEEKTLKDVSVIHGNYGLSVPSTEFNGVRYLRITDITEWGDLNDEKVSAKLDEEKEQELLEEGDILFARTGATVGKTLMYKEAFGKCLFAGYLIRYRLKKEMILPKFLFYITHSDNYYKWVLENQKAAAQPNISAKLYNEYLVLYPPLSEQQSIVATLDSLKSKVDRLQANYDKISQECDALKQAILRQVFE